MAGEPVIVDIFPRDQDSRYFGDMTRTFVAGEPDEELEEMYEATKEAQEAAFEILEQGAGVTGREVHEAVLDCYEEAG
ncbi:MAG: M24 family metallopeptidase, partial [Candidatus Nanohaloarchaea archaeon]|nr:M24 family metallopeptidase [Candidatus Nanohaloarchaea archaeon]